MRRVLLFSPVALLAAAIGSAALAQERIPVPALRTPVDPGDRVVITGMVPIPDVGEGAPPFSSRDLAGLKEEARDIAEDARSDSRRCAGAKPMQPYFRGGAPSMAMLLAQEYEVAKRVTVVADRAAKTTELAEASRRDAGAGTADMKLVEARELDRQEAVRQLQEERAKLFEARAMIGDFQYLVQMRRPIIDWFDLEDRAMRRRKEGVGLDIAMPEELDRLDIQNVKASQHKDKKGKDIVVVTGEIRNSSQRSARIPDLSVAIVDDRGWTLTNTTVSPPWNKRSIGAGKAKPFQVEVRPAPDMLKTAVVTFAAKNAAEPRLGVGYFCSGG